MSTPGQSSRYLPHFDAIRGVAILGVFLFHAADAALQRGRSESLERVGWAGLFWDFSGLEWWEWALLPLNYGGTRVALFFVLSGFCIHLSHQRARQPTWHSFANRRFFRIFPPYIVALCLFIFVWPWGGLEMLKSPYWVQQLLMHLPAVHNFHSETLYGVNPSFWTLAVEVQLYALYPVLVWLRRRFDWPTTLGILGAGEFSIRLLPVIALLGFDVAMPTFVLWSPFAFWFSWSLGAYAADCFLNGCASFFSRIRFDVVLLVAALVPIFSPTKSFAFPVFALASAIIVDRLRNGKWDIPRWIVSSRVWRHLSFLGVMSYSFYLLHQPIIQVSLAALDKYFPQLNLHPLLRLAIAFAVYVPLLPVAYTFFRTIERPSITLGEWFWTRVHSAQIRPVKRDDRVALM